jgi:hypothetical protein
MPLSVRLPLRASLRRAAAPRQRDLVTSSIAPSLHAAFERPENIVLVESSLYSSNSSQPNSWKEAFESFYPAQGLNFSSIDMFRCESGARITSVKSLEQTLAADLSHLSTTTGIGAAHTVLIARGPIQSLVAQYFLESSPLAGLVLVDPLLLPNRGVNGIQSGTDRWDSSLQDFISLLDGNAPSMYKHLDDKFVCENVTHPLLLDDGRIQLTESKTTELSLLASLSRNKDSRVLLLEPGSVPMLIFYSCGNEYEDYYRICAEVRFEITWLVNDMKLVCTDFFLMFVLYIAHCCISYLCWKW